jgi:DNA-directed RNA polymerase subunit M/transcription elongation factor TFIIS
MDVSRRSTAPTCTETRGECAMPVKPQRITPLQEAVLQSIIPKIQCPRCGATMRLSKILPLQNESHRVTTVFDCECGFEYRQSDRVRNFK